MVPGTVLPVSRQVHVPSFALISAVTVLIQINLPVWDGSPGLGVVDTQV